jgi:hypothetical protein
MARSHYGCRTPIHNERRRVLMPVPLQPGQTVETRRASPDEVRRLFPTGLAVAAGYDPVALDPASPGKVAPILWDSGEDRLVVHIDRSSVAVGDGFIDTVIAVQCDETQLASVVATFVTATMNRPAGFIFATEDRPRGPALIVDRWGDALVALAWRALVHVAASIAGGGGRDAYDRAFVASTVIATPDGLLVVPMVPHRFVNTAARR